MRALGLILSFVRVSFQEEAAYQSNFFIHVFYSLLNLVTGVVGLSILFSQVQQVNGWDFSATLALLGVYLTVSALRSLFIAPGLEALAGMDGEIWSGRFDFTLLRPLNIQFLVSLRKWRLFSLFDLLLGWGVLGAALVEMRFALSLGQAAIFLLALFSGLLVLYAILLGFTGLVFWSPDVLFTWLFDGLFQMARYPLAMYPGWLRWVLTWIVPVGMITSFPADALRGALSLQALLAGLGLSALLFLAASLLFRQGLRRYASASS